MHENVFPYQNNLVQRETYFTLYTVDDDVQLRSTAESPVENKILLDNSSRIIPVTVNDYSPIPLNKPHLKNLLNLYLKPYY